MRLILPLLAFLLMQPAAAAEPCPPGTMATTVAEAYFGRNAQGREVVDDAAWAGFLDEVVTPAFPDGLSVLDAAGQWRNRAGTIGRERTKLLVVAMPGASLAEAASRMAPVREAYRTRFGQESVMLALSAACLGF